MKNIVFIGMPGAGKSTIGVVIAKIFGYDFVDSDLLIQNQEGDILEHLIEKHGIEGFLQIENQVNRDINVKKILAITTPMVLFPAPGIPKKQYFSLKSFSQSIKFKFDACMCIQHLLQQPPF